MSEEQSEKRRDIIDLCCFVFGVGICVFLMYIVGNIIYQNGDIWAFKNTLWIVVFSVLSLATIFLFWISIIKLKMIV